MRVMDYNAPVVLKQHDFIIHAVHKALNSCIFGFHFVWGIHVFELEYTQYGVSIHVAALDG